MASLDSLIQEEHRLEDLLGRQDVAPAERAEFIAEAKACAEALVRDGKLFLVSAGRGLNAFRCQLAPVCSHGVAPADQAKKLADRVVEVAGSEAAVEEVKAT
jgi:hypothetical protein